MKALDKIIGTIIIMSAASMPLHATQYSFYDDTVSLSNSSGDMSWGGMSFVPVLFGKFTDGFSPTAGNSALWQANWELPVSGLGDANGYYDPASFELSASLDLIDNAVFGAGDQLYLWVLDSLNPTDARSWLLLTDPSWVIGVNSPILPGSNYPLFTADTQAVFGSFDFTSGQAGAVPEPADVASVSAGLVLLACCLWRARKGQGRL